MKTKITQWISLIVMIIISLTLINSGRVLSKSFGPISPPCQNLTWQGYYENDLEWVAHDSCIIGNYTWKEDCRFILPWWKTSRCLLPPENATFWNSEYPYNETCDENLWITNESQMGYFNTHCVTTRFIKAIPILPFMIGIIILLFSVAAFISLIIKELTNEKSS
jgi:hypothetical protein